MDKTNSWTMGKGYEQKIVTSWFIEIRFENPLVVNEQIPEM